MNFLLVKAANAKHTTGLFQLYNLGENERVPTLISRLKFLENELNIPQARRIPDEQR